MNNLKLGGHLTMKFNTQGLALVIVFQLFIVGATLSITATNAGALEQTDPSTMFVPFLKLVE